MKLSFDKGPTRSIYKKLLIAAVAVYVAALTYFLSDMYHEIGQMKHAMIHMPGGLELLCSSK